MMKESKRPVTVEDLLRFKRAERPPQEFWTRFDQELRAKQLSALVEKRPWWRSLPRTLRGLARYNLPLGATAVLAITFLSIRDYHPVASGNEGVESTPIRVYTAPSTEAVTAPKDTAASIPEAAASTMALSSDATQPGDLARMVPQLPATSLKPAEATPSERSIAKNLAVAQALLGTPTQGFESRALPARSAPQEPLEQMTTPAESRRSRFASAFASMTVASTATSARVARRLSDEQLYDSIHRFGASGNTVSIKF
jgi:hypothetical protein